MKIEVKTCSGLKVYSEYDVLKVTKDYLKFKKDGMYIIDSDYEGDISLIGIEGNNHSALIYDNRGERYSGLDALEEDIFVLVEK